jgi:putative aldouronate transport system substrate-binding protein
MAKKTSALLSWLALACMLAALMPSVALGEGEMLGNMYLTGLPIVKEKVTYTIAVPRDSSSRNTFPEKAVVQEMENQTNVHIEWLEIPASGWDEKVNITLASGDLPDAFASQVNALAKNLPLFHQLDEYLQYAPNILEMFELQPELKAGVAAPDGKIYSLPTYRSDRSVTVDDALWVYTPWLEKLGLEAPTTTDEFVDMLRAFRDQDPNGNGQKDEIPLGLVQNEMQKMNVLFAPFGVVDTGDYVYPDENHEIIFPAQDERYYEGLKWIHELYAEKLLDPEMFTITNEQFNSKAQNPDKIYGVLNNWLPDIIPTELRDYEALIPLVGPNGDQLWTRSRMPGGRMAGYTITRKCQTPEVLVRWYDNNISTLENVMLWYYGPEETGTWKRDETGTKWMESEDNVPEGMSSNEYERTITVGGYAPAYLWIKFDSLRIQEERVLKRIAANEMYLDYAVNYLPNGIEDPDLAADRSLLFVDIDNYMRKFKANAVVSGIDDAGWQAHLAALEQLRVDEYINLWQRYYDVKKDAIIE